MRIVDVTKPFTQAGIKFEAGHRYVMAEDIESQYRSITGDSLGMSYPIETMYKPYKGQDLTGKRILSFRTGGVGDIFMVMPVLRYLKKKYPTCFIRFATGCRDALENVPEIDELYSMPFDAKLMEDTDYQLFFQGILESSSEASQNNHGADMFFSYFSIDSTQLPDEDKRPRLFFKKEETDWRDKVLSEYGIKEEDYLIGMQMETSAPLRNFPKDKMKSVIDILSQEGNVKIFLIGSEAQAILGQFFKGSNPKVSVMTGFSVRQSLTLATRYNLVISPDSFMVQAAGALEKPLIGLYGPFPSTVRMKYFKNAIALEPSTACTPCFKHDFRPCVKGFPSPCFSLVTIEDVLQAADYLKAKFTGSHFKFMERVMANLDLTDVEKYMMSADKGLCFFGGYYDIPNALRVDSNPFVKADISDLSTEFKRDSFPFVLYVGPSGFDSKNKPYYDGSKNLVRPGGHFIVYSEGTDEAFFAELQKDIGRTFILLHTKFDPARRRTIIVGKRAY